MLLCVSESRSVISKLTVKRGCSRIELIEALVLTFPKTHDWKPSTGKQMESSMQCTKGIC